MDIKRIKDASYKLFGDQLWELNTEGLSGIRRRIVRFIKLIRITFNTFAEQRMGFQCVALSYFSALAIVPFAAFKKNLDNRNFCAADGDAVEFFDRTDLTALAHEPAFS